MQVRQAQNSAAALAGGLEAEAAQIRQAELSMNEAQARLQPLMDRAGVADSQLLAQAIERSDRHRVLAQQLQAAQARLLSEGDGHGRELLQAEIEGDRVSSLPDQLPAPQTEFGKGASDQTK